MPAVPVHVQPGRHWHVRFVVRGRGAHHVRWAQQRCRHRPHAPKAAFDCALVEKPSTRDGHGCATVLCATVRGNAGRFDARCVGDGVQSNGPVLIVVRDFDDVISRRRRRRLAHDN